MYCSVPVVSFHKKYHKESPFTCNNSFILKRFTPYKIVLHISAMTPFSGIGFTRSYTKYRSVSNSETSPYYRVFSNMKTVHRPAEDRLSYTELLRACPLLQYACMYACVCVCVCVYIYIYARTSLYIPIMYVCVCI